MIDELPKIGDLIVYCARSEFICAIGIYWNDPHDPRGPVPSRPDPLRWENVTHWFKIDPVPKHN